MRWAIPLRLLVALVGVAGFPASDAELQVADADAVYHDAETGFVFSEASAKYSIDGSVVVFRVAVPSPSASGTGFDVVLQVVSPKNVGWVGLAWGGGMARNPLTVAWWNNNQAVVSSRYSPGHTYPTPYSGATVNVFKTGTKSNGTHWQFTAKCTGCTTYTTDTGRNVVLNPNGGNRLAFAYAASRPSNPASNLSSFSEHDVFAYWSHDFNAGKNTDFQTLVAKNLGR
ncbi:cellobiose dehydrogenase-like protein [Thozetella sp. PMI_491]|nr:cellobiose dehydrogenase-like protein [Thozetella sp. PMI_491]